MRRRLNQEEWAYLYRLVGEGIWQVQHMEDALQTLITIKVDVGHPGALSEGEAFERLARYRSFTLGKCLKVCNDNSVLPWQLAERLSEFKADRDWLVHRSVNSHSEAVYSDEGRAELFDKLVKFITHAKALQAELKDEIQRYAAEHGVDIAETERRARAKMAEIVGDS